MGKQNPDHLPNHHIPLFVDLNLVRVGMIGSAIISGGKQVVRLYRTLVGGKEVCMTTFIAPYHSACAPASPGVSSQ